MPTQKIQPLTFSEYRIANGIWLQQQLSKQSKALEYHTAFYYDLYLDYLRSCGLNDLIENLKSYHFSHRYFEMFPSYQDVLKVENTMFKKRVLEIDMIVTTYNLKY